MDWNEEIRLSPAEIRNFWAKVRRGSPDECWEWQGWRNATGHARFELRGGKKVLATHVSLVLAGQPRPPAPNDYALHGDTCSTAGCVNPAHLRWGNAKENAEDRERLGRRTPARGERHGVAKLTEDQVRYIRASPLSQYALARELGVSQPLIGKIRNRVLWTHVA